MNSQILWTAILHALVSEEQVNAELAQAENCTEIESGEPDEDHGTRPPFGELEEINEILALHDQVD